jgi:chromate transporter
VAAIAHLFEGLAPAVIAILAVTLWRLFRTSVRDIAQVGILVVAGGFAYAFPGWEPLVLLGAAALGLALYWVPRAYPKLPMLCAVPAPLVVLPVLAAALVWDPSTLRDLAGVFLRAGGLLFGGGYVLIPLVEDDVTTRYGWLTEQQFLDGVALGQVTPGPIVITATFVGYGAAGLPGAVVATLAVFAPSFVFAIAAGRFLDAIRAWRPGVAALKGVAPAVVATIAAVSARLGRDAIHDAWTAAIFVAALGLAWRFGPLPSLALAGAVGVVVGPWT